jgi:hypothetical protein
MAAPDFSGEKYTLSPEPIIDIDSDDAAFAELTAKNQMKRTKRKNSRPGVRRWQLRGMR